MHGSLSAVFLVLLGGMPQSAYDYKDGLAVILACLKYVIIPLLFPAPDAAAILVRLPAAVSILCIGHQTPNKQRAVALRSNATLSKHTKTM